MKILIPLWIIISLQFFGYTGVFIHGKQDEGVYIFGS